jgi:hypothetical protein
MPVSISSGATATGSTMSPLALTEAQLNQIMQTASALPLNQRDQFLRVVAGLLPPEPGDGEVFRACREALRVMRWDSMREAI